jgi:spore coat protein U-like protein
MRRSSKIAIAAATVAAAALAVTLVPRSADAATQAASFTVTANVATACTIGAANVTLAYDPNAAVPTTAPATVTLHCTNGTHYDVGLLSTGRLLGAGGALNYSIFKPGTTNTPWTDTGSGLVSGSATAFATAIVLAGTVSIPPAQDVAAGAYVENVTATVTF